MAIEGLSAKEQDIVLRCMRAATSHIDDWEKHSRLGIEPEELQSLIVGWPRVDDLDESGNGFLAINNCMNEVCHGFRITPAEWSRWFDTPMDKIESAYRKWLALKGISRGMR
jgi:hypothetical protein